ncbi:MAG TPA: zf-TFIIB domain-containing protein [Vicinamibacterales bacterium]|nr:zf-TFIIB domain-containing protein [Vicinamibacterales bacterium]
MLFTHDMNCPVCKTESLMMSERQGIEIDYCPKCRGVWLDRGELDKLIEKASASAPYADRDDAGYRPPHSSDPYRGKPYKKRKGMLSELFDFD